MHDITSITRAVGATIIDGSCVVNPLEIIGNSIELTTDNKFFQTIAKVLQSANVFFITTWTVLFSLAYVNVIAFEAISFPILFSATCILAMSPLILPITIEKLFPNNKEKMELFQKNYSTALKIVNILAAAFVLANGIYHRFHFSVLALSISSISSSMCALYKNLQPKRVSSTV